MYSLLWITTIYCNNANNDDYTRVERRNSSFFFIFTISSLRRELPPPPPSHHVLSSGHGAIVCKSRATHGALITCNMCSTLYEEPVQYLSFRSDFLLGSLYRLKPFTEEGGEETGLPGKMNFRKSARSDPVWRCNIKASIAMFYCITQANIPLCKKVSNAMCYQS